MKRNGRLVKRIVTQESVNRYCEWLYGCEKSSGTIKQYKHYLCNYVERNTERENGSGDGQQCTGSSQWIFDA